MSTRRSSPQSTRPPSTSLRLGATLRGVASTYRRQWRTLLPVALIVFVPLGLVEAGADHLHDLEIGHTDLLTGTLLAAVAAGHVLASGLGDQFYAGVVAAAVSASRGRPEPHSLRELAHTIPYARLIAVDVVVSLGTAVGLVLLVVPGIVFYTWYALAAPVVEIEGLGLRAAFRRSRRLVRGSFWQVLVLLALSELASDGLTALSQDGALWAVGGSFLGDWAAAAAVGVLVTPLIALAAVVATFQLIDLKGSRPPPGAPEPPA